MRISPARDIAQTARAPGIAFSGIDVGVASGSQKIGSMSIDVNRNHARSANANLPGRAIGIGLATGSASSSSAAIISNPAGCGGATGYA